MEKIRRFEDLEIFQIARGLCKDIYIITDAESFKCDYRFTQQIRAAAGSIMDNIAEGFESGSDASFVRYLQIAKGSCSEVKSMLFLCEDFQICTSERRNELQTQLFNLSSGIYKLIQFLIKKQ